MSNWKQTLIGANRARNRAVAPKRGILVWAVLIFLRALGAQDSADFYNQNCAGCHSIGGGAGVGPDLKDVSARQSREWLIKFIVNPDAVVRSNDAYAKKMVDASSGMVMPAVDGVDRARAAALLDYIDSQSKQSAAPGAAEKKPEAAFSDADRALGREIVMGSHPLSNGGPACIGCHTLGGIGALGGGRLGPDLTHEFEKLGGRRNITAWLTSPATPTMRAVYKDHALQPEEIAAIAAYFESASKQASGPEQRGAANFILIGIGGSLVGLVLLDGFWRKRFRAVRRPLVARRRA